MRTRSCALLLSGLFGCSAATSTTVATQTPEPLAVADASSTDPTGEAGPKAPACDAPSYAQFDFWLGRFEVRTADGTLAGHNHIEKAHGGCALIEHWASAHGGSGTSTNQWVPARGKWVQHWVDASGSTIDLEGGLEGESMVLVGDYHQPGGDSLTMRGTWTPLDDGRVRQFFETTADGMTWTPWFEGFYSRVSD